MASFKDLPGVLTWLQRTHADPTIGVLHLMNTTPDAAEPITVTRRNPDNGVARTHKYYQKDWGGFKPWIVVTTVDYPETYRSPEPEYDPELQAKIQQQVDVVLIDFEKNKRMLRLGKPLKPALLKVEKINPVRTHIDLLEKYAPHTRTQN